MSSLYETAIGWITPTKKAVKDTEEEGRRSRGRTVKRHLYEEEEKEQEGPKKRSRRDEDDELENALFDDEKERQSVKRSRGTPGSRRRHHFKSPSERTPFYRVFEVGDGARVVKEYHNITVGSSLRL